MGGDRVSIFCVNTKLMKIKINQRVYIKTWPSGRLFMSSASAEEFERMPHVSNSNDY